MLIFIKRKFDCAPHCTHCSQRFMTECRTLKQLPLHPSPSFCILRFVKVFSFSCFYFPTVMEVAAQIISLGRRDLPLVEYSREFCRLAIEMATSPPRVCDFSPARHPRLPHARRRPRFSQALRPRGNQRCCPSSMPPASAHPSTPPAVCRWLQPRARSSASPLKASWCACASRAPYRASSSAASSRASFFRVPSSARTSRAWFSLYLRSGIVTLGAVNPCLISAGGTGSIASFARRTAISSHKTCDSLSRIVRMSQQDGLGSASHTLKLRASGTKGTINIPAVVQQRWTHPRRTSQAPGGLARDAWRGIALSLRMWVPLTLEPVAEHNSLFSPSSFGRRSGAVLDISWDRAVSYIYGLPVSGLLYRLLGRYRGQHRGPHATARGSTRRPRWWFCMGESGSGGHKTEPTATSRLGLVWIA